MSEIKMTPIKVVDLWNAIGDTEIVNDLLPAGWIVWAKRFKVYAKPETEIWNSLTEEERTLIMDDEIDLSIKKLNIKHVPDHVPAQHRKTLQEYIDGDLPEHKTKLEQLLEAKKNESNTRDKDKGVSGKSA